MKLELIEKARKNVVYLQINFAGGDADTEHPEEYLLKGIEFSQIKEKMPEIEAELAKYSILKDLLSNHGDELTYDEVLEAHGREIASLFDNAPNDPQSDYQFKCYLDDVYLIAYDEQGDKYRSYTKV